MVKILTTTELPEFTLAESFVAVGINGRVSVLSGFPSPSVSGLSGLVPFVISVPLVTPSLSQSNADQVDHTVLLELGAVVYEHASFGLVPLVVSVPFDSPSPSQSAAAHIAFDVSGIAPTA